MLAVGNNNNNNGSGVQLTNLQMLGMQQSSRCVALSNQVQRVRYKFRNELKQVDLLIAVLWDGKEHGYWLGMEFKNIIKSLSFYEKFNFFKSIPYVHSLLKALADPDVSVLEMDYNQDPKMMNDDTFNLTSFGLTYYNPEFYKPLVIK